MNSPSADSSHAASQRIAAAVERTRNDETPLTGLALSLCAMSTGDAVSEIGRLLRSAVCRHASGSEALEALDAAALALEAVGLRSDAGRLRLAASAALEGWELGAAMQDAQLLSTMIASAVDEEMELLREKAQPAGDLLSLVLDADGEVFAESFASGLRPQLVSITRVWRESMLEDGTVIPVGRCPRCTCEVRLEAGRDCPMCGRKIRRISYTVVAE